MYTIAIDLGGTVVKIGLLSDGEIVDCVRAVFTFVHFRRT